MTSPGGGPGGFVPPFGLYLPPPYAFPAAPTPPTPPDQSASWKRFLIQFVVVPLVGVLIGTGGTLAATQIGQDAKDKSSVSCLEQYKVALDIAKIDPAYRLPATDPVEQQCGLNAALDRTHKPKP